MRIVALGDVIRDEVNVPKASANDPLHYSYCEFVAFFATKPVLNANDVTLGAYMAYGWMPTILKRFKHALRERAEAEGPAGRHSGMSKASI